MKIAQRWIIGISLAVAAGAAAAGEDSTERWGGYGPAYWETSCGLQCFSPGNPQFPPAPDQP